GLQLRFGLFRALALAVTLFLGLVEPDGEVLFVALPTAFFLFLLLFLFFFLPLFLFLVALSVCLGVLGLERAVGLAVPIVAAVAVAGVGLVAAVEAAQVDVLPVVDPAVGVGVGVVAAHGGPRGPRGPVCPVVFEPFLGLGSLARGGVPFRRGCLLPG